MSSVRQGCRGIAEPERHLPAKEALLVLDLSGLRPLVEPLYSPRLGAPARPPEDLLRSLVAMTLCGVDSFDVWVERMQMQPFYAVISGFAPDDVPAVGTFCLFIDRLLGLADRPPSHRRRPRPKRRDTHGQSRDKNKDTAKHQDVINRLATRLMRVGRARKNRDWTFAPTTSARRYDTVLKAIFYTLIVPGSVERG